MSPPVGRLYPTNDDKTGQLLYKPKVGRPPRYRRNATQLPIGEYLYGQKGKAKKKRTEEGHELKIAQESKKIVQNRKVENFASIFGLLDSDSDGLISAKNVNIAGENAGLTGG